MQCNTVINFLLTVAIWEITMNIDIYASSEDSLDRRVHIGLGLGLDYGGIGTRVDYCPVPYWSVFGAFGYNLVGAGYNIGFSFKALPTKGFSPNISLMYGYNAVRVVDGLPEYDKTYYGLSGIIEFEIRTSKNPKKYLLLAVIFPFNQKEFRSDIQELKDDPNIDLYAEPLPIRFSIGYHFANFSVR